ncbi:MAG TPA: Fic family protein [Propioniciclava sp.]|uniref:Fic family protein n=1 Tax=Propioniciclava sp. TaxID=2038686 RepID=UPI002CA02C85|nr:Fic/DOC family N-terminal domain-containing protein [Propioniciclava sp.]HRL50607.1 Fic family protein [Propioniciclava sp.]
MDVELFQKAPFGTLVPISGSLPGGRPWEHWAFLPNPLPDESPELSGQTYRHVGDARAALAALDSTAQRLPNPKLFRSSTLRLEAQSTAALEGTYEPLSRVLAADSDDVEDPSLREVINYVIVAETAFSWAETGRGWGSSSLANLQGMLMRGTTSDREHSGQVRPVQVVIGRREGVPLGEIPIKAARYVPPPPGADLQARLQDLIVWMQANHDGRIDPVVAAAMGHYEFEALHPFHDGNGRLGRLLIVLQLYASGVLTEPTLSVSTWFEARRTEYYDALLGVSTEGDWSTWVAFFAQGLAASAEAARTRMLALASVQAELKEHLQSTTIRTGNARVLIDFAVGHPTFTVAQASKALGIGSAGAKKLIDSLVTHGILAPYDERVYGRRFHAPRVLDVLLEH